MEKARVTINVHKSDGERSYTLVVTEKTSVLQALGMLNENGAGIAYHKYCCGFQYCNSCLMVINGQLKHACLTILEDGMTYDVAPWRNHEVIKDLVVRES